MSRRVQFSGLACASLAHADFSYLQTRKSVGGPPPAGDTVTKQYLKGQKMKIEGKGCDVKLADSFRGRQRETEAQSPRGINAGSRRWIISARLRAHCYSDSLV